MSRKLLVVSNREPYVHQRAQDSTIVCRTPPGGVHLALDTVLRRRKGVWVAWGSGSADREASGRKGRIRVPPGDPRYTLRRVWLSQREIENFYHGYSNQVLWPLCHALPGRIRYRRRFWEGYRKASEKFCRSVLEEAERIAAPLVWIQDYQLALLPSLIRAQRPDLPLATFWHIPWPGWNVYRISPDAEAVLASLLANDWIGFHLEEYAENFIRCARRELGAKASRTRGWVEWNGRRTWVRSFPLGIDVRKFRTMAGRAGARKRAASLLRRFGVATLDFGIGVDRLDYSKGILERLDGVRIFFRRFPQYRGKFTFLQIASPSREGIPAYWEHRAKVRGEVRRINRLYGTRQWKPVVLVHKNFPQEDLAPLYRLARLALVTSLRDGMNLVAKEFVVSQLDRRGSLILSRFAGVSKELPEAYLVNPYDVEEIALALRRALRSGERSRRRRLQRMQRRLEAYDIHAWSRGVLRDIERICRRRPR